MKQNLHIKNIHAIYTMAAQPNNPLGITKDADIWVKDGLVMAIGKIPLLKGENFRTVDAGGGVILPGLIDCHTHLVFAGNRRDDFVRRAKGETYSQIMAAGGGILSTVAQVRNASLDQLVENAKPILAQMLQRGVTTIEAKSGYGLDVKNELKLLEAIRRLQQEQPINIAATFLGAHAIPPGFLEDDYTDLVIQEMLPAVAEQGVATACDVFVEKHAFGLKNAARIFAAAKQHGLNCRIHAEQLSWQGGAELAANIGALSASHLEYATQQDAAALAQCGVVAELLPIAQEYLGSSKLTPARMLVDAGVKVAIATDFNPGSAMSGDLHLAARLAVTRCGLTCEEALLGITRHAATALGRKNIGTIEAGQQADLCLLATQDAFDLLYDWSKNPVVNTFIC